MKKYLSIKKSQFFAIFLDKAPLKWLYIINRIRQAYENSKMNFYAQIGGSFFLLEYAMKKLKSAINISNQ